MPARNVRRFSHAPSGAIAPCLRAVKPGHGIDRGRGRIGIAKGEGKGALLIPFGCCFEGGRWLQHVSDRVAMTDRKGRPSLGANWKQSPEDHEETTAGLIEASTGFRKPGPDPMRPAGNDVLHEELHHRVGRIVAVESGLAIAALTLCCTPQHLQILGKEQGLSPMVPAEVVLYRSRASIGSTPMDHLRRFLINELGSSALR